MTDSNPYAAPTPTDDEARAAGPPIPKTFRQAWLQGLKLGFKWGNRIALTLCGLSLAFFIAVMVWRVIRARGADLVIWEDFVWEVLEGLGSLLLLYGYLCVIGIIAALIVSTLVHAARKLIGRVRRH